MAGGELGQEHLPLRATVSDEDVANHRALFLRLAPEYADYMDKKSDDEIRDSLARAAWLASIFSKKDS